jgi:GNAT superfamily N-acetyltransferase
MAASDHFDGPARGRATRRFLSRPGHHLLIAYLDGEPVGRVTGVEVTHPDKGTEMFLYGLGVAEAFRGRGIRRDLAALAMYRAAGGTLDPPQRTCRTGSDALRLAV